MFVRAVSDRARAFDGIPLGYQGDLYAEISPRTFSVLARTGDRLLQLRVRRGVQTAVRDMTFSLDLHPTKADIVGYRAKRHSGVIDLAAIGAHAVEDFWEPVRAREGRIVLDPGYSFAKTAEQNLQLLSRQAELGALGRPLLVGWSRKGTLGVVTWASVKCELLAEAHKLCFVAAARLGGRVTDISHAVESHIRAHGTYGILEDYTGHGIGTEMHMAPNVPNYGRRGRGPRPRSRSNVPTRRCRRRPKGRSRRRRPRPTRPLPPLPRSPTSRNG